VKEGHTFVPDKERMPSKMQMLLSENSQILSSDEKQHPCGFTVIAAADGKTVWELRAPTVESKEFWMTTLQTTCKICKWLSSYRMGGMLGKGAMGVVRKWYHKETGLSFALKQCGGPIPDKTGQKGVESDLDSVDLEIAISGMTLRP
jgi:hypothetical protein